jgi:4-amino-4-deoxy-L-arabinose transferase-like glycosyltransferase
MAKNLILGLIVTAAFFVRVVVLDRVPPSLYWDEASLAYNAYSIAQTGRDEHGEFLPWQRFIAFGDYKPPGYIYAAAAAIKLFGPTDWAVRLPSALAGTLLVLLTFFLVKQFTTNYQLPTIGSLFVALSPWAIHFSRGAFEANLATLFSGLGIFLFIWSVNRKSWPGFAFCALSFALALYTFNSHRIFVPLMVGALGLIYFRDLLSQKRNFLLFALCSLLFVTPLVPYLLSREARLRLDEVSWTKDLDPIVLNNKRVETDGGAWWAKVIHNRRIVWAGEFAKHYADSFKPEFLFHSGDDNKRLSIQSFGELYWLDLPFLLAGIYFLIKNKSKFSAVILAWAFLAPIPAALARETPHALRMLNILPVPQIITAYGVITLLKTKPQYLVFSILYLVSGILYLRDYLLVYPVKYSSSWQYGYKELVEKVKKIEDKYNCISVTGVLGRPYIYFLWYNQYPPQKYWATRNIWRDWFGFWYVEEFGKYRFGDDEYPNEKCLYVRGEEKIQGQDGIKDLGGQTQLILYEK